MTTRRLGLFFCRSPHYPESRGDFDHLKQVAAGYGALAAIQEAGPLWSPEFWAEVEKALSDKQLEGLILVSDLFTPPPPALSSRLQAAGLPPEAVEVLIIETLPEFLHLPPAQATLKAEVILRRAISRMLAKEPLQWEDLPLSRRVLVLGQGLSALKAAANLAAAGLEVVLASGDSEVGDPKRLLDVSPELKETLEELLAEVKAKPQIEIRLNNRVVEFRGTAGRYVAVLSGPGESPREYLVGGVVVASEPELSLEGAFWGLESHERLLPLTDFAWQLESGALAGNFASVPAEARSPVVFVLGFAQPSQPVFHRLAYQAALRLVKEYHWPTLVLLDHLKVADHGLEALAHQAREAGVIFVKFTGQRPRLATREGLLTVGFFDEVMGQELELEAHFLVLEEKVRPSAELGNLAEVLEIFPDPQGFLQGDQVYNLPIFTNRTGILAVGPARGSLSPRENLEEAQEAALQLFELLRPGRVRVALNRVQLDRKKCAICLTCYRLCPHRAISVVNRRPHFSDLACRICGLCASECPMDALQVHNYSDTRYEEELRVLAESRLQAPDIDTPWLVVFACRNSALMAARLAAARRLQLPAGMEILEVSCAGKVDPDYVLRAFREGADGVLVLACHPESCQSFHGSPRARERVELLREVLLEVGLEADRLRYATLAPGMSQEFARMTREMWDNLLHLGKNPLRESLKKTA